MIIQTKSAAATLVLCVTAMGLFSKSANGLASKIVGSTTTATGSSSSSSSSAATSSCPPVVDVEARLRGALWGFFAGDALAAPTHWYYGGRDQVVRDYGGPIVGYTKPKFQLWGSILNKSNLNGGGRATVVDKYRPKKISIIGDVINHGKQQYWDPNESIHYHATLEQGENTLEASLARVLMKSIVANEGVFNADHFRQAYMDFMMTPGSHNDTYASTCHRMFFANLKFKHLSPQDCPDNDQHNVDTIDGLVLPTIAAMTMLRPSSTTTSTITTEDAANIPGACAAVTRKSQILEQASRHWGRLVQTCLLADTEEQVTTALQTCAKAMGVRRQLRTQGPDDMTACYLSQAVPALLDMVARYHTVGAIQQQNNNNNNLGAALQQALLSNANVGGENVHRGSILGAVLGARAGESNIPPSLVQGLYHHDELAREIDDFVMAVLQKPSSSSTTTTASSVSQQS